MLRRLMMAFALLAPGATSAMLLTEQLVIPPPPEVEANSFRPQLTVPSTVGRKSVRVWPAVVPIDVQPAMQGWSFRAAVIEPERSSTIRTSGGKFVGCGFASAQVTIASDIRPPPPSTPLVGGRLTSMGAEPSGNSWLTGVFEKLQATGSAAASCFELIEKKRPIVRLRKKSNSWPVKIACFLPGRQGVTSGSEKHFDQMR